MRTTLTVGIIGVGIMALIAMITATESLKENIKLEFSSLGTNTFTISPVRSGGIQNGRRKPPEDPIDYLEAKRFAKELEDSGIDVSASINASMTAIVSRGTERTNPNVQILGVDEQYLNVSGIPLLSGRGISKAEAEAGAQMIVIGTKIQDQLFKEWESPVGEDVLLGGTRYFIVGVLESRGSSFGISQDNQCLIPIPAARRQFSDKNRSYMLACTVSDSEFMDSYIDEATGAFRMVRGISLERIILLKFLKAMPLLKQCFHQSQE